MRNWFIAGATLAVLTAGGVAMAQQAPSPPPPPPGMDAGLDRGPEHGWRHGGMMRMHRHMQDMSKAAHFHLRRGDAVLDIKCAADEPTKACIDAATALLDKLPK